MDPADLMTVYIGELRQMEAVGLEVTVFIDDTGRIRDVYASGAPLDEQSLTALVRDHLGVSVP